MKFLKDGMKSATTDSALQLMPCEDHNFDVQEALSYQI